MPHVLRGLLLASVLAGAMHASVAAGPASAAPADMPGAQDGQATERSVSLVIRVRPDQLKKAVADLAQMVQGGEALGLPWLKQAFGAISAEIIVEDEAASGSTSTAFRASSAGWVGRDSTGTVHRDAQASTGPVPPEPAGTSTPWIDPRYATAAAIIGRHAAAIRDGASALMDSLPADQAGDLRQQIQQLSVTAGAIGKVLEGVVPARPTGEGEGAGPKR